jgi:hypothetical protein
MKTTELVQLAKASDKEAFGTVPDNRAVALVTAVFAELSKQIRASKEPVAVGGFGRFMIREKMVTKDGEEVSRRRIGFRPAQKPEGGAGVAAKSAAAKKPGGPARPGAAKKAGAARQAGAAGGAGAGAGKPPARRNADDGKE